MFAQSAKLFVTSHFVSFGSIVKPWVLPPESWQSLFY